jgi:hypothetical protein
MSTVEQGSEQSCASGSIPLPTTKVLRDRDVLFSEFSLKDLEGIKIFLIFIKKWTAECFSVVVPHTHLEQFSSPRYKLEKC